MGADEVIRVALAQVGKPYAWAKAGPDSFDCSGLVVYAYKLGAGIDLPHFTGALWTKGSPVRRSELAPGDLLFPDPGHVQIYIGNNKVVSAPHTGAKVRVDTVYAFWGARRIIAPGTAVTGDTGRIVNVSDSGISGLIEMFKQIDRMAVWLSDSRNWVRIGLFAGGFMLALIALARSTNAAGVVKKVVM